MSGRGTGKGGTDDRVEEKKGKTPSEAVKKKEKSGSTKFEGGRQKWVS